jgi:glyoxylase-like metal-dependent hydrolase (beta-lactamase superfamily II)
MKPREIANDIYLVGNSDMTDSKDCSVYLLDFGELVLIDTGVGEGVNAIIKNIEGLGLDPEKISTIILTHRHIDHVGGAHKLRERFGARIIIHTLDADSVEGGDTNSTGASWYRVPFGPLIVVYLDKDGKRILFGQDIHGPFLAESGANMFHWKQSMEKLITLNADILCEGHFGIYQPAGKVTEYIERYLEEYGA